MMKSMLRKALSLLLAAAMFTAALTGCSSKADGKEKDPQKTVSDSDTVFSLGATPFDKLFNYGTESDTDFGDISVSSVTAANGRYYVLYNDYMKDESLTLVSFDENGKDEKMFTLPAEGDSYIHAVAVAPDSNIYYLRSIYSDDGAISSWKVNGINADGSRLWEKEIDADEDFFVINMISSADYTLILSEQEIRLYYNGDGSEIKLNIPVDGSAGRLCTDGKDGILYVCSGDYSLDAWKLNVQDSSFEQAQLSADGFFDVDGVSSGNDEYDFLSANSEGVYGFKLDGSKPVKILDYINSDLVINAASECAMLSPESILLLSFGVDGEVPVLLLHKVDPSLVEERKVLTLGCVYADDNLRRIIVNYNKANSKYRIKLHEFSDDAEGNISLNTEIAAGNIPDIISLTWAMPFDSYASKGLFEDLEPLFEADPDLDKEQFFTNILDAFRMDGKMYYCIPGFNIMGLMGKQKDFKDTRGVTIPQIEKMIKEKGLGYDTAMGIMSRDSILIWNLYCAVDQYIDWDQGTCNFDSESFINLLKFAEKFPEEINYENIDWEKSESGMREGTQLLRDVNLYSVKQYMTERYGYIGEETTFMGYFGNGGNSPSVIADLMLAISSQTKEKDACWDFIRAFYLDEYQENLEFSFPVSRKAFQKQAEKAMAPETYTYVNEDGEEEEEVNKDMISLSGKTIEIPLPTQKDIDDIVHIIEGLDNKGSIDNNINTIVLEEAEAFFAGQKSAEETADIIQSRAKVYMSETR